MIIVRSIFLIIGVVALGGCAVLDGLSGGGGGTEPPCAGNCPRLDCSTPFRTPPRGGFFTVDVCDQFQSFFDDNGCGSPFGFDAIIEVPVPEPGSYTICLNGGIEGTLRVTEACTGSVGNPGADALCTFQGNCQEVVLSGPSSFLAFRTESPDACGQVSIDVFFLGGPEPFESSLTCLDGIDNDSNGLTDCSDPICHNVILFDGDTCDARVDPVEVCDGVDNGTALGFDAATGILIDESACRCITDDGCRGLFDNQGLEYRCHLGFGDPNSSTRGVCNPDCNLVPWCQNLGAICLNDGTCLN